MIIQDKTDRLLLTHNAQLAMDNIVGYLSTIDYDLPVSIFAYPVDDDNYNQVQISDGLHTVMQRLRLDMFHDDETDTDFHADMFVIGLRKARGRNADPPPDLE